MTLIEGWINVEFTGAPTTGTWNMGTAILDNTGRALPLHGERHTGGVDQLRQHWR